MEYIKIKRGSAISTMQGAGGNHEWVGDDTTLNLDCENAFNVAYNGGNNEIFSPVNEQPMKMMADIIAKILGGEVLFAAKNESEPGVIH